MKPYTRLGNDLRAARNKTGWTQETLAGMLGCERQRIILWEGGKHRPNLKYRAKLETLLGSFDWSADPEPVEPMSPEEAGADMRMERRLEQRTAA